jgi:cytochrome c-type biogenesis protein CcmH
MLFALVGLALAGLALLAAAPAIADQALMPDIEDEVMCPVCGTTLELANGPQADRERALIRRLDEQGLNKEQIKDQLVAEYGEDVLATPDSEGFDLAAWVVPGLGIALAAGAIGLAIARLGRRRDRGGESSALEPEQDARIDRDMKSYDL